DQVKDTIASSSDTEKIISLNPDIVFVASFTEPAVIQQLRDAGLTVFALGFATSLDDVRANARLLGQAVGEETAVEAALKQMDNDIDAVTQAVGDHYVAKTALYLTPGNYTSGAKSTIADILHAAGVVDVAAAANVDQNNPISDEFIIQHDPDAIFLSGWTPY